MLTSEGFRLILFLFGVALATLGWFVDKATAFPSLLRILVPEYHALQQAFAVLDEGQGAILPLDHPGAEALLKRWQPEPPKTAIEITSSIGRSTGIFNVITGMHRYELRLLVQDDTNMLPDFIWSSNDAKQQMNDVLESSLLRWKGALFFFWSRNFYSCRAVGVVHYCSDLNHINPSNCVKTLCQCKPATPCNRLQRLATKRAATA